MMNIKSIKSLAAVLIIGCAFVSCSSDNTDDILNENDKPTGVKSYTLIVNASKGNDAFTRALSLSGSTLSATWSVGDEVKVYNGNTEIGTLTAQNSGANTTLKGKLTSAPSVGDNLTLKYLSPDYAAQEGTLEYIAANCDYAVATITVNTVNTTEKTITTTGNADFQNQQAIVKFTLTDNAATPAALSALKLRVTANSKTYIVTPTSATDVLYVAIAGISSKDINLVATVNGDIYTYAKSGVTFVNSQYYTISVRMRQVEAINLGLPSGTKWANMNIGAMVPEGYGDYISWGETIPPRGNSYLWESYKWCNKDYTKLTKYCSNSSYGNNGYEDILTELEAEDDAATVNWGSDWCMPTKAQWDELINNTNSEWTTENDVYGRKFTSIINNKSIFIPATGHFYSSAKYFVGVSCFYYSSTLDESKPYMAWAYSGTSTDFQTISMNRVAGLNIRPVLKN